MPSDAVNDLSVQRILSISVPMLMTSALTFVIGQTGILVLGMYRPEAEVGYYAIAVKLATLTTFVLNAINTMAAPKFSELFHRGKMEELFHVAKNSTKLIFWTTVPILVFLVVLGKPILVLLYGPEFDAAYSAMILLMLGQFVNSSAGSTGYFMNMTGNQIAFRNIVLGSAAVTIGLSFTLIPLFGILGAAFAGMVSIMVSNLGTLVYIKVKYGQTIGYLPTFQ